MIRALLPALGLAAALLAAPVAAQAPAPMSATPDAATLAAARALMKATDIQAQMHALAPRIAEATGQQLRQMFTDNHMPEGLQTQMTAAIQANMASLDGVFTPQVIDQMAAIYARHFTAAELQRLTVLMDDPAMVKFRAEMPNTMSEMMPVMFAAIRPQQEAFQAKMKQIVADWIKQHPEDKAKLRSPNAS